MAQHPSCLSAGSHPLHLILANRHQRHCGMGTGKAWNCPRCEPDHARSEKGEVADVTCGDGRTAAADESVGNPERFAPVAPNNFTLASSQHHKVDTSKRHANIDTSTVRRLGSSATRAEQCRTIRAESFRSVRIRDTIFAATLIQNGVALARS